MADDDESHAGGNVIRALGVEIRNARTGAGLTQSELVDLLPSDIHVQTLATYERGIRQCTVGRLLEICRALGVSAPDLLERAIQKAQFESDLRIVGVLVDMHAMTRGKQPELRLLRQWARNRLAAEPDGPGTARLGWIAIQELAMLASLSPSELVSRLVDFTPQSIHRRHEPRSDKG